MNRESLKKEQQQKNVGNQLNSYLTLSCAVSTYVDTTYIVYK